MPELPEKYKQYLLELQNEISFVVSYKQSHEQEDPGAIIIQSDDREYILPYDVFNIRLHAFYNQVVAMDTTFKHAWGEFKPDEEEFLVQLGGKINTYANDETLEERLPESDSPGVVAEKCKKIKEVALKHETEKERRQSPYIQMQGKQLRDLHSRYATFYEDTRKRLLALYGNANISPTERLTDDDIVDTLHTIESEIPPESTFDTGAQSGQYEDRITKVFERAIEQTFRKKYEERYRKQDGSIASDEQSTIEQNLRKKIDILRTDPFITDQALKFASISGQIQRTERILDRIYFESEIKTELFSHIVQNLQPNLVLNEKFITSLSLFVDKTTLSEPAIPQTVYQSLISAYLDAGIPINQTRLEQIDSISSSVASQPIVPIARLSVVPEETSVHTEMKEILAVTFKNSPLSKWMETHPQGARQLIVDLLDIPQEVIDTNKESPIATAETLTQHVEQVLGQYVPGITHTRLPDTIAKKLTGQGNLTPNDIQTNITDSLSPSIRLLANSDRTGEMSQIIHQAIQSLPTTQVSEQYVNAVITYAFDQYDIPLDEQTAIIRQSLPTLRSALISGQSLDTAVQTLVNQLTPQIESVVQKNQTPEDKKLLSNTLSSRLIQEQEYIRSLKDEKPQSDYIASLVANEVDMHEIKPLSEMIVKKGLDTEGGGGNHGLHFPQDHEHQEKPFNRIIKQQNVASKAFEAALADKDGKIPRFYFASISNGRMGRFFGALLDVVGGKGMLPYYLTGDKEAFKKQQSYLRDKLNILDARINLFKKQGSNQKTLAVLRERRSKIASLNTALTQIYTQARPSFINRWLYRRWQNTAKPRPFSFQTINQFISPTKPITLASYPNQTFQIAQGQRALAIANQGKLKKPISKPQTLVAKKGGFRAYLRSLGSSIFANRQKVVSSISSGIGRLVSGGLPFFQFAGTSLLSTVLPRMQRGVSSITNPRILNEKTRNGLLRSYNSLRLLFVAIPVFFFLFLIIKNVTVATAQIQDHEIGSGTSSPNPQNPPSSNGQTYWLFLHRKSSNEVLYQGIPGDTNQSKIIKEFYVSPGLPGKHPTPLPRLFNREYWLINRKLDTSNDPATSPRALILDIPFENDSNGPVPYKECYSSDNPGGQCDWGKAGWFGLHGVGGNRGRIENSRTHDNDWSFGCIQHFDDEIKYLYDLLGPLVDKGQEIRYYVDDN